MIFGINTASDISKLLYVIWNNFEISRVVFMPNITRKSWYYLFILLHPKVCNFHMYRYALSQLYSYCTLCPQSEWLYIRKLVYSSQFSITSHHSSHCWANYASDCITDHLSPCTLMLSPVLKKCPASQRYCSQSPVLSYLLLVLSSTQHSSLIKTKTVDLPRLQCSALVPIRLW